MAGTSILKLMSAWSIALTLVRQTRIVAVITNAILAMTASGLNGIASLQKLDTFYYLWQNKL